MYDIVGDAIDLIGEDDGVGADAPPKVKQRPAKNQRRLPLGFASLAVAAGATVTVTVIIQNQAFRLEELVIPSAIAPSFTLEDIKVGNRSQFAASGSIPASMFSELCARPINLRCETAQSGLSLALTVKNTSAGPLDFRAGGIGTALE